MRQWTEIGKENCGEWLGRPVWYQSTANVNNFGWGFIHPDTPELRYCRLILPDQKQTGIFKWNEVRLFSRPVFHGICRYCAHWQREKLIRCGLMESGKKARCSAAENRYEDFEPAPGFREKGFTEETFRRKWKLAGYQGAGIRKGEKNV